MKLWLLRPIEALSDDPWKPWYDKAFGFVVRAETEDLARQIAHKHGGDENTAACSPWLSAQHSTCVELTAEGEPGYIIEDFHSA